MLATMTRVAFTAVPHATVTEVTELLGGGGMRHRPARVDGRCCRRFCTTAIRSAGIPLTSQRSIDETVGGALVGPKRRDCITHTM